MKFKKCIIMLCFVLLMSGCGGGIQIYKPFSEIIGNNYFSVIKELEDQGFTNIKAISDGDLSSKNDNSFESVKDITVNGESNFEQKKFSADSEIVITYHDVKKITLNFGPATCRNKSFDDITKKFDDLGFISIKQEFEETSNENNNNRVYDVSINGNVNYDSGDIYDADSEIIIFYYQYKEENCSFQYGAIQAFRDYSNYYLLDTVNGDAYSWSSWDGGALKGKLYGSFQDGFIIKYSSDWSEKLIFTGLPGEQVTLIDDDGFSYTDWISVKPSLIWSQNKDIVDNYYTYE